MSEKRCGETACGDEIAVGYYTGCIGTKSNARVFLSAGEASGDHYGARLMAELKGRLPGALFTGLGGAEMEAEGQQRVVRAEDVAVMGITEILRHVPRILASYRKLVRSIKAQRPDVAVLIDFPDVNFRLAKHLKRAGVPVVWFVSPQLWAWKRGRLRWVQERVAKMLTIFPFEEEFYRRRGVEAEFVGHPLAEMELPGESREAYAERWGLDSAKPWIALLPGSRWKELRANLPALHELAASDLIAAQASGTTFDGERLDVPRHPAAETKFEFVLPVASTIERGALEAYLRELNAEHVKYMGAPAKELRLTLVDDARAAMWHARASVVASGTATIQAAMIGNPFVVVYRVSPLTFAVAKKLVEYPEEFPKMADAEGNLPIAMVNLIAGRRVVPELLQERFTAQGVAAALAPLLVEGPEREEQMAALAEVRRRLEAPEGGTAMGRLADAVVEALDSGGKSEAVESTSND